VIFKIILELYLDLPFCNLDRVKHSFLRKVDCSRHISLQKHTSTKQEAGTRQGSWADRAGGLGQVGGLTTSELWESQQAKVAGVKGYPRQNQTTEPMQYQPLTSWGDACSKCMHCPVTSWANPGNTNGGSITVLLTSCLTSLD
jgi:hypothetical protein